jgi:predicted transglutaminase-like cysteine proteinase
MSKELLSRLAGAAVLALADLAAAASAAGAQTRPAPVMTLGEAAPAPPGFLAFCARTPDQCGLPLAVGAQDRPADSEALGRALYAKYYWSVAFGGGAGAPSPAFGVSTAAAMTANGFRAPPAARGYDWSAVFGRAGAPAPASAKRPDDRGPSRTSSAEGRTNERPAAKDRPRPIGATALRGATTSRRSQAAPQDRPKEGETRAAAIKLAEHAPPRDPTTASAAGAAAVDAPPAAVTPLAADRALMAELDRVNQRINRAIRYVSDKALYGDEDYWHLSLDPGGPAAGDCKDYVLEKRRALIADGVPAADLSIAVVETGWRETHAVLLVATDRGELVLDSLSSWVQPWWKVRYRWIERQAPGRTLDWVSVG